MISGDYMYLADRAVFLGSGGRIEVFPTRRALAGWLAGDGVAGHDLAVTSTWPRVVERARAGELEIVVDGVDQPASYRYRRAVCNGYQPDHAADLLDEGSRDIEVDQVRLARELLTDIADWSGDDKAHRVLADSHPLGRLLTHLARRDRPVHDLRKHTNRIGPRESIAAQAAQLRELIDDMRARFRRHPDAPWPSAGLRYSVVVGGVSARDFRRGVRVGHSSQDGYRGSSADLLRAVEDPSLDPLSAVAEGDDEFVLVRH